MRHFEELVALTNEDQTSLKIFKISLLNLLNQSPECVCVESNHVTRVIPLTTYSALSNSIIIMTSTFNIPINMKISNIHQNSINNQSSICGNK